MEDLKEKTTKGGINFLPCIGEGICCVVCAVLILIVGIFLCILLPVSLKTVRYDEYGILYNWVTKTIDSNPDHVREPGLYWVGSSCYFFKITRVLQTIAMDATAVEGGVSLSSRTGDGLSLEVDISFQYSIKRENVIPLFLKFGNDYKDTVISIGRDILRDTSSMFDAIQFFENRKLIGNQMFSDLKAALEEIHINVEYFQLRDVRLPDDYESIIEQKEVSRMEITEAQLVQNTSIVEAQTEVVVATETAKKTIFESEIDAKVTKILGAGKAEQTRITTLAKSQAYSDLSDSLSIGLQPDQTLKLMWFDALKKKSDAYMLVDLEKPAIISLDFSSSITSTDRDNGVINSEE